MSYNITINMKNNISGVLHYQRDSLELMLPLEHTGDYSMGYLVFINELDKHIKSDNLAIKSQVLRDLQQWSKTTGQKLSW